MRLAPDLTINIKQYLDRVDRVFTTNHYGDLTKGTIRIIDYKTGSTTSSSKASTISSSPRPAIGARPYYN